MIKEATAALIDHNNLTYEQANAVVNEIMNGETSQVQTAAFLAALSAKGETIEEISACAAAMRDHALPVEYDGDLLEIVGTGGDGAGSFNISTTASLVIAAGGIPVAKHGNRAASSKKRCGRLSGSTGSQYRSFSGEMCGAFEKNRHLFLLRAEIPYLHEIRRTGEKRAGGADSL